MTIYSFTKKRNSSYCALLDISDIYPSKMNVQGAGAWFYTLMELSKITLHTKLILKDEFMINL